MVTSSQIVQGQTGTQLPASNSSSAANPYNMSPGDFIQLMVTQLENQDPTQPTSSSDLLTQVSQIGQLESSTQLQSTMQSVTLQSQVGSASALIGKTVVGIDANNNKSTGVVSSVSVAGGAVSLNLDNGDTVAVTNLSSISGATTATTTH
jgi:flagellar basal-body rod modification protein FlgD